MSLDLLVSRVENYWKLLLEGKKLQAARYVFPSDREKFQTRTIPAFMESHFKSLELLDERTGAQVLVIVKRILPIGPMDWPVTQKWVFDKDNWYLRLAPGSLPILGGTQNSQIPPNAEQIEAARRELKAMLRFEKSVLDFGTVRQESAISLSLKYTLTGNEPVRVAIKNSAPGIEIQGLKEQSLIPGQLQELTILVPTLDYDGAVNERIVLTARRNGVEVPFDISIRGFVYVPISARPRILRFNSIKGEGVKEILVRNNSKSKVELKSLVSETDAIVVEPLPTTLEPGQELKMQVRQVRDVAPPDLRDNLSISFAQPVDSITSLALTVVLNYGKEDRNEIDKLVGREDIQELIQKNQRTIPKR